MPRYACFTTRDGKETWWQLLDHEENRGTFFCNPEGDQYGHMTSQPYNLQAKRECRTDGVQRTDHTEVPDHVWARITVFQLLKGPSQ